MVTIEEFKEQYNDEFIKENKLSAEVLEYYINNYDGVKWTDISIYQTLSESFIDKYSAKIWWYYISAYQTLSEPFIIKYMDRVNWYIISINQTLSEPFIIKYSDKVNWSYISMYQTLSEPFIDKYRDKVDWVYLLNNNKIHLNYELILEHLYRFSLYDLYILPPYNTVIMDKLIKEFPDKYRLDKLSHEINRQE